ncbi:DUF1642 domain-containing protein [Pediococcus pentosaceus]|uniref:DUF1642 domain-containing protein n=1 Tax=Pediococcus pentosaceus TaxID=1255 RepID=UPI002FBDB313
MTKDEYVKTLEKHMAKKALLTKQDDYYDGYFYGLEKVIDLAEKLDEPKKVVIPELIANDIDRRKKEGSTLRNSLEDVFGWGTESCVHDWFVFVDDGDENIRKYISAWDNGYEIEKETKYQIPLPGFQTDKGDPYVVARTNKGSWYAVADLKWDNTKFTSEELKQAPEWVQQLKPEGVEDD